MNRKLVTFQSANDLVFDLAFPAGYNNQRADQPTYTLVMDKCLHADAATRRIARQIEAHNEVANTSVITNDGLRNINTGFSIHFRGIDKYMGHRELLGIYRHKIVKYIRGGIEN